MANQHGSSGITGKLIMVVGLAAIAGLLWWLSKAATPSAPTVSEALAEAVTEDSTTSATIVDAADFARSQRGYQGQDIDMGDVNVAQVMSPEIIWVELPGGMPFLVKLTAAGMASRPEPGARVRVVGLVLEKTDSVLDAWQQSGAILDAGQRAQSEFGSTFIEARLIRGVGGSE